MLKIAAYGSINNLKAAVAFAEFLEASCLKMTCRFPA
jgi:hypothetical protein